MKQDKLVNSLTATVMLLKAIHENNFNQSIELEFIDGIVLEGTLSNVAGTLAESILESIKDMELPK